MRTVLTLLLVSGLVLVACQRQAPPRTPLTRTETGPPGTVCQRVCWRTFGECTREVLTLTVRVPPKQLLMYQEAGLLRAFKAAGFQRCMQMCGRTPAAGFGQSLLSSCMRLRTCNQYAACITPRGGLPTATSGSP